MHQTGIDGSIAQTDQQYSRYAQHISRAQQQRHDACKQQQNAETNDRKMLQLW